MRVSIPSMPGRFFRRAPARSAGKTRKTFQSPRCRGASSDGRRTGKPRGRNRRVSIPSMPGRFFRHAGWHLSYDRELRMFQSPRCRGASSDPHRSTKDEGSILQVSIPSMPGRFFRPGACCNPLHYPPGVSIPSMPGRFFRRTGRRASESLPSGCFNPLDAGALLQTGLLFYRSSSVNIRFNPLDAGALLQTDGWDPALRPVRT